MSHGTIRTAGCRRRRRMRAPWTAGAATTCFSRPKARPPSRHSRSATSTREPCGTATLRGSLRRPPGAGPLEFHRRRQRQRRRGDPRRRAGEQLSLRLRLRCRWTHGTRTALSAFPAFLAATRRAVATRVTSRRTRRTPAPPPAPAPEEPAPAPEEAAPAPVAPGERSRWHRDYDAPDTGSGPSDTSDWTLILLAAAAVGAMGAAATFAGSKLRG